MYCIVLCCLACRGLPGVSRGGGGQCGGLTAPPPLCRGQAERRPRAAAPGGGRPECGESPATPRQPLRQPGRLAACGWHQVITLISLLVTYLLLLFLIVYQHM